VDVDPGHWGPGLTYGFLSPIFDSISKQGYAAAKFDPDHLRAALHRCQLPIIALGGISPSNVGRAAELGFSGVAVLGSVWQAQDPEHALREIQQACDRAAGGMV